MSLHAGAPDARQAAAPARAPSRGGVKVGHPAAGRTRPQVAVFEQIAIGNDVGHPRRTLAALERKGLIVGEPDALAPTRGCPRPMTVTRYHVPLPIFTQWCEWCDQNQGDFS